MAPKWQNMLIPEEETSHDFQQRYPERIITTNLGPLVFISMGQGDLRAITLVDIKMCSVSVTFIIATVMELKTIC